MVSHMEGQGRPRRIPDAEMGPQRAQMESQGNQKESKGSPKRATGRAKWTPRGSWKDAACGPTINGKHKAKQRFCEVRAASSVPKGIRKMPSERPSGQRRAQRSQSSSPGPKLDTKRDPKRAKRKSKKLRDVRGQYQAKPTDEFRGVPPPSKNTKLRRKKISYRGLTRLWAQGPGELLLLLLLVVVVVVVVVVVDFV